MYQTVAAAFLLGWELGIHFVKNNGKGRNCSSVHTCKHALLRLPSSSQTPLISSSLVEQRQLRWLWWYWIAQSQGISHSLHSLGRTCSQSRSHSFLRSKTFFFLG